MSSAAVTMLGSQKKAELIWIIEKDDLLEFLDFAPIEYERSPYFYSGDEEEIKWHIKLYPNGDSYSEEAF